MDRRRERHRKEEAGERVLNIRTFFGNGTEHSIENFDPRLGRQDGDVVTPTVGDGMPMQRAVSRKDSSLRRVVRSTST